MLSRQNYRSNRHLYKDVTARFILICFVKRVSECVDGKPLIRIEQTCPEYTERCKRSCSPFLVVRVKINLKTQ